MSDALNDVRDHLAGARAYLTSPVVIDHIQAAVMATSRPERDVKAFTNERPDAGEEGEYSVLYYMCYCCSV